MCLPSSGQVCSLDGDLVFVSQIPRTVHSGELNLLQFRTSYIDLNDIVCFLALDVVYRMGLSLKERTENDKMVGCAIASCRWKSSFQQSLNINMSKYYRLLHLIPAVRLRL